MIPDWKLEKYLTGDLPASEMRELRELEATDELFAGRVRMFREDNLAILRKMPFESLEAKLAAHDARENGENGAVCARGANGAGRKTAVSFKLEKFAAAVIFVFAVVAVVAFMNSERAISSTVGGAAGQVAANTDVNAQLAMADVEDGTRIKGMDSRMEIWKKTEKGIVQLENLSDAREGDEIQLRYSVPQKCFGILFSMDGNGTLTMHMGNENKAIALEPGKMVTLPFAYKLDNAPKFEKFFLLTSQNEFELDAAKIDELLKKEGVSSKTLTLRKVEGGK
ncbi:MAG: hypothetical protein MJY99_11515 [Fibrobacter sp.]|nr:hypothetical protein [Fibrobacter sp.]